MNTFILLSGILQSLAQLARSSVARFEPALYAELLELLSRLAQRGSAANEELRTVRGELEGILERGRAPTAQEIEKWARRSQATHEKLTGLKSSSPDVPDDVQPQPELPTPDGT